MHTLSEPCEGACDDCCLSASQELAPGSTMKESCAYTMRHTSVQQHRSVLVRSSIALPSHNTLHLATNSTVTSKPLVVVAPLTVRQLLRGPEPGRVWVCSSQPTELLALPGQYTGHLPAAAVPVPCTRWQLAAAAVLAAYTLVPGWHAPERGM